MDTTPLREDLRVLDAELRSAVQRLEEHAGGLIKHGLMMGFALVCVLSQSESPYASNDEASTAVMTIYRVTHDASERARTLTAQGVALPPQLQPLLAELLAAADRFPVSTQMSPNAFRRWSAEFQGFASTLGPLANAL